RAALREQRACDSTTRLGATPRRQALSASVERAVWTCSHPTALDRSGDHVSQRLAWYNIRFIATERSSAVRALVSAAKPLRAGSGASGNTAPTAWPRGVVAQSARHRPRTVRRCHFECAAALRAPASERSRPVLLR